MRIRALKNVSAPVPDRVLHFRGRGGGDLTTLTRDTRTSPPPASRPTSLCQSSSATLFARRRVGAGTQANKSPVEAERVLPSWLAWLELNSVSTERLHELAEVSQRYVAVLALETPDGLVAHP